MQTFPIIITAKLWLWKGNGPAAWHFITVEQSDAEIINDLYIWPRKGFGSIPVKVKIGKTEWKTSVFPQKEGTQVLPIKKSVRDYEKMSEGDNLKVTIEVINT